MDFNEQLRRRVNLAKSQGWNDDEIQRSALIEQTLHKQQVATQQQQQPAKTGGPNFGDIALSLLPFGTIAKKALTGHGNEITAGEVGGEALLTALPFGLGRIAKGARAVVKGAEAVGAATAGTKAATTATELAEKSLPGRARDMFLKPKQPGAVTQGVVSQGEKLRASARGVVTGAKPEGASQALRPDQAQNINNFLNNTVKAKGSVQRQIETTQSYQQRALGQLNAAVERNNKQLSPDELGQLTSGIRSRIVGENGTGIAGFDSKVHAPIANAYASQLGDVKDYKGLLNFKRSLDKDAINYGRNSNAPDPMREQIARAFRDEVSKKFSSLHPDIKTANQAYGQAESAIDALIKKANPSGIKPAGTSINGQGVGGRQIQAARDLTGRTIAATGRAATIPAVQQAGVRAGANILGLRDNGKTPDANQQLPQNPQDAFGDPQNEDEFVLQQLAAGGATDFDTLAQGLASYQNSPQQPSPETDQTDSSAAGLDHSSAELFNAAMRAQAAGDSKGATSLLSFAKQAAEFEKTAATSGAGANGAGNVTKVTAQQYGLAQGGAQSLQELVGLIKSDPNVLTRTATPGRSLPIAGGFISNAAGTGRYDAIGYNIADSILRLRTGATANESEVRKLQAQIMPRAGDSDDTVQTKIGQIQNIFGNVLQLAGQPSTSSLPDNLDQLLSSGTGY